MSGLTRAQTAALEALGQGVVHPGLLFPGNGVSLPTVRVLQRLGLAHVQVWPVSTYNPRSGRTKHDVDWKATMTDGGWAVLKAWQQANVRGGAA